jgi:1-acyl-sn-glycerol-3-phosphate acyltransferase
LKHPLAPSLPRSGNRLTRAVGRLTLGLLGWRIEGELPDLPKLVIIVAPHTSNWDFAIGLAAKFALGLHARWLGKDSIFRWPAGPILRRLGGIPVDRRSPRDVVAACVHEFERSEAMVLGLAPAGTRSAAAEWRSGFWHIAHGAAVPILPVGLDSDCRAVRLGVPLMAEGRYEEQLPRIREWFAGFRGIRQPRGPHPASDAER